jgi:hypothetical protein
MPSSALARVAGTLAAAALLAAPLAAQATSFRGNVSYEKVLATRTGLALGTPVRRPAAGVRVEVLAMPERRVLGSAFTGADGGYHVPVTLGGRSRVYVRAVAETENARVVRTGDRSEYALVTPVTTVTPGQSVQRDLFATDDTRMSGPFNIAVTLARANAVIRAAQPSAALPRVEVRWDTLYVGGTYFDFDDKVAFINGRRSQDSDEFDDHVVAHEYGHFLMASFSREDSPGGDHGVGEQLDPRLAWSEGWADFFSGVTTGDPIYIDTGALRGRQRVLVTTDLELNVHPSDRPGIWSEHSVGSALWDWYDDRSEPGDSVALGFTPMWTAFTGPLRKDPDAYLLDFADALSRSGATPRAITQVLGARRISYGSGRFPHMLQSGITVTGSVDSRSTRRSNLWRSSAHYGFILTEPRLVSIHMKIVSSRSPTRADLDLVLFDGKGEAVARSDATNGVGDEERISRRLLPGYYRVEVRSWSAPDDSRLADANAHEGSFSLSVRF